MVSSYTANLAAFLTVETPKVLIENVKDLAANKEGVVYGAKRTGSTRNFFSVENLFANSNFKFFKTKSVLYFDRPPPIQRIRL